MQMKQKAADHTEAQLEISRLKQQMAELEAQSSPTYQHTPAMNVQTRRSPRRSHSGQGGVMYQDQAVGFENDGTVRHLQVFNM
jgi:hypothetical protein